MGVSFNPSKIVAVGLNYRDHARELKMDLPDYPLIFMKPSTSVIGDGDPIVFPAQTQELHYEGELGIVMGKRARNVPSAKPVISSPGTCANDVTARDLQRLDGQRTCQVLRHLLSPGTPGCERYGPDHP